MRGVADWSRGGPGPLRVVLVGKSALDPVLRRDPGFELLRPRGATDAIGELAEVTRPGEQRPTLVLVSEGVVRAERVSSFASAVRRVEPNAKVVAITGGRAPEGYDGAIDPAAAPDDLRRLMSPVHVRAIDASTIQGRENGTLQKERAEEPRPLPHSETRAPDRAITPGSAARNGIAQPPINVHERTPLGAILSGKDPIEAAMASVRALLGENVRFVPTVSPGESSIEAPGAPVTYSGKVYGRLVAEGVPDSALAKEASWLGGWAALAAQQDQLRKAAFTDELTGAWNRRYFQRFLAAAVEQARTLRRTVSLLVFDIDNFKLYNDRYGHSAGDDILVESVRLLKNIVRPSDRVCRVGGDEFVVIFYDPEGPRNPSVPQSAGGLQSVTEIARRFRQQICEHRFPKLGDEAPGTLTISGGMATFPWDGQTATELLERADALAMTSKRQGKNIITLGPGAELAERSPDQT